MRAVPFVSQVHNCTIGKQLPAAERDVQRRMYGAHMYTRERTELVGR